MLNALSERAIAPIEEPVTDAARPVAKSFIETQLPVSLLSKECYKERKAGAGQTLTALGSYWKGRKPLILVRACILGCLLPATEDPKRDRDIFLKLMLMDEIGLKKRWQKGIPASVVAERLGQANTADAIEKGKWKKGSALDSRNALQERAFKRMSYDEKLEYCLRPEEMPETAWDDIWPEVNRSLGTTASSLPEFTEQLGLRRFGHRPRVADTFCGGGSIPFEAARMGCDVYASDLNPIAAMLTWGALNIIGGEKDVTERLAKVQAAVAAKVRNTIDDLGVEEGADGWRGKVYLYCLEVRCPQTGWLIPLAPSWVISETKKVIAQLVPDHNGKRFGIEILTGVSEERLAEAKLGTVRDGLVWHPLFPKQQVPLKTIRGDGQANGNRWGNQLRLWTKDDVVPRSGDIYGERLYCIQWTRTRFDHQRGREVTEAEFRAVDKNDLRREQKVLTEVTSNLLRWQQTGVVPDCAIEPGDETTRLSRERGWTHWHHLFHPRQLLTLALYKQEIDQVKDPILQAGSQVLFAKLLDWNTRLCRWITQLGQTTNLFYNQALNTLFNFGVRSTANAFNPISDYAVNRSLPNVHSCFETRPASAHLIEQDIYITDPPYGDAVNYHEITEFFIAWLRSKPPKEFSHWTWDSRRTLAVKGNDPEFRKSMVLAYSKLAECMTDDGVQVLMFTHNSPTVWAGIASIVWAAGLQISSVWNVGTETSSDLKQGNFVQGTALMILRKRTGQGNAWSHKMKKKIRASVENTLEFMMRLDKGEQPNFSDSDYQHSAYAAALSVLTKHRTLDNHDIVSDLLASKESASMETVEALLEDARRYASEFLVPRRLDAVERQAAPGGLSGKEIWSECFSDERFYLKAIELESNGENRLYAFQQIAKGFGAESYSAQMPSVKANSARVKTGREWKGTQIQYVGDPKLDKACFGASVVRHALYGVYHAMENDDLRGTLKHLERFMPDYWERRKRLIGILEYLATCTTPWRQEEARWARDLAGAVLNHGS